MALETRTFVNGQWTTQTVDVNSVLRHYDRQDELANITKAEEIDDVPVMGLLSQTLVWSPLVRWIFPAKLRHPNHGKNDVAFIGDGFVQIKELRPDGHLSDVIRMENFGSRIRNARIVGSVEEYNEFEKRQIKVEDDDFEMALNGLPRGSPLLPPQVILLQLVSGHSLFLRLRYSSTNKLEFVISSYRVPSSLLNVQPGMQLSVDPSSRYAAIGCSQNKFVIYSLYSRADLEEQYGTSSHIEYVQYERQISFDGTILKLEFLYPATTDRDHIILLLLSIVGGKTKMFLYEWQTGTSLQNIRAHSHKGHPLEASHQAPIMLIPLTIKSAFLLISETSMAVCSDILQGTPQCTTFSPTRSDPPTAYHHGFGTPLWQAWTRPVRLPYHTANRDDIYIVREDGLVRFLEINTEEFVQGQMNIGEFEGSCGTALASLRYDNESGSAGDLLVTGGDSCAGGTYLVRARSFPIFIEPVQNWSPVHDFVTTFKEPNDDAKSVSERWFQKENRREIIPKPDRLFACVGKGIEGSIIEFNYGLEARIGLEVEYETPIIQVWALSRSTENLTSYDGIEYVMSLGDRTTLLHLSSDAQEITEIDQESTPFMLGHRTIAASTYGQYKIQITEQSITVANNQSSATYTGNLLLTASLNDNLIGIATSIDNAFIYQETIIFTMTVGQETYLQLFKIEICEPLVVNDAPTKTLNRFSSDVTCISMFVIGQDLYGVVAEWQDCTCILTFQSIHDSSCTRICVPPPVGLQSLSAIVSIAVSILQLSSGIVTLLCGLRNGTLMTLDISTTTLEVIESSFDRFGATPTLIVKDLCTLDRELFFINCDSKLYSLTPHEPHTQTTFMRNLRHFRVDRVWLTDASNPSQAQPGIDAVARLGPHLSRNDGGGFLLISGTRLLLTGLNTYPKVVPRHLRINGTPFRLLYSFHLEVLIVAVVIEDRTSLLFIDPNTAEEISQPVDKEGKPVEYVSGLGQLNERIYRLLEWSFVKDGKTWQFIIVCTTCRLLIISTEVEFSQDSPKSQSSEIPQTQNKRIKYWTRHKFKLGAPVFSVVGFEDGLIYCSGEFLYCDTLDLTEKRFKRMAKYELPSPAVSLWYHKRTIFALTNLHSLEILRLLPEEDGNWKIIRTHGDQVARHSLHHQVIEHSNLGVINLISDKENSAVGLWASDSTKADVLEPVLEAQLPHSILRFQIGKCRPIWDPSWTTRNSLSNSTDIFGASIDGSLSHCTFLNTSVWRFLRFIINLALSSPLGHGFTLRSAKMSLEPVMEPKIMMHIDGNILNRIVMERSLERLLAIGSEVEGEPQIFERFCRLLEELDSPTNPYAEWADEDYINMAYAKMEFYLRPPF